MDIIFDTNRFSDWNGGVDFQAQLIRASLSYCNDTSLILRRHNAKYFIKNIYNNYKHYIAMGKFGPKKMLSILDGTRAYSYPPDIISSAKIFKETRNKIISPEKYSGKIFFGLFDANYHHAILDNAIGYLFDLQFKYYPELFNKQLLLSRDAHFESMLESFSDIIVNSQAVKNDIELFYPQFGSNIHVLPFSPCPDLSWLSDFSQSIDLRQYEIDKDFFLVANQFWRHKGHDLLFRAFKLFAEKVDGIDLVCTGDVTDPRSHNYHLELVEYIRSSGLKSRIKLLGFVDKKTLALLIKKSIAVVQPTFFEGGPGGGIAHDALSLGKRILLSDIDVNKEISSFEKTTYFTSGDIDDLSNKMLNLCDEFYSSSNLEPNYSSLLKKGIKNRLFLGSVIDSIAQHKLKEKL